MTDREALELVVNRANALTWKAILEDRLANIPNGAGEMIQEGDPPPVRKKIRAFLSLRHLKSHLSS